MNINENMPRLKKQKYNARLYKYWANIRNVCNNPRNVYYSEFGEKNIHVFDKWVNDFLKFQEWAMENGYVEGSYVVRLDLNNDFKPNNCIISSIPEWEYHNIEKIFKKPQPATEKHGMTKDRIYSMWAAMKDKCYNKNSMGYHRYGAVGIEVFSSWRSFPSFYEWAKENGYQDGKYLVRRDASKSFTPDNCFFDDKNEFRYHSIKSKKSVPARRVYRRLYGIWSYTRQVCHNESHTSYSTYGGKGIEFFIEWHDFNNFLKWALDNGYKEGMFIRRHTLDGDFEPSNVYFSEKREDRKSLVAKKS